MAEFLPNDLISIVTKIMSPYLKHLRRYVGEVKSISDDGEISIHSVDYGTYESDPTTWVNALAGNWLGSRVYPEKGDIVEFYFADGTADTPRWSSLDGTKIKQTNDINTIYEYGTTYIKHYYNDNKFEIAVTTNFTMTIDMQNSEVTFGFLSNNIKLTLSTLTIGSVLTGSTTIKAGSASITLNSSGISMVYDSSKIDIKTSGIDIVATSVKINGIDFSLHTHGVISLGSPTSPPT